MKTADMSERILIKLLNNIKDQQLWDVRKQEIF